MAAGPINFHFHRNKIYGKLAEIPLRLGAHLVLWCTLLFGCKLDSIRMEHLVISHNCYYFWLDTRRFRYKWVSFFEGSQKLICQMVAAARQFEGWELSLQL